MKKTTIYALTAAALLSLAGCQDEAFVEQPGTPVQEGEEIVFGSALPDVATHRTVYGTPDVENQVYPVYWEYDANDASVRDHVKIYCLQAAQEKLVEYIVQPGKANSSTSQQLERVGDCGLQWSDAPTHNFYGFYPAASVKGTETGGRILSDIPATQYALDWEDTQEDDGSTTWRAATNTDYAAMVAYTSVETGKMTQGAPIPLSFKPLTTILEIVVNGPHNTGNTEVTVTNINVRAAQGSAICGQYYCNILAKDGQTGELDLDCEPAENPEGESRNNISIPTYNRETGFGNIKLKRGDKMVVHAFLVPTTDTPIDGSQVTISVASSAGVNRKTLTGFTILPHKVNRIVLPAVQPAAENNWLTSLDPNTYLTELSIPGSVHSALTPASGGGVIWHDANIEQQFNDGIRAFYFQTGAVHENGDPLGITGWRNPEMRLAVAVPQQRIFGRTELEQGTGDLADLKTSLNQIAQKLAEAKSAGGSQEFAVVQVTFASNATDYDRNAGSLANDKYNTAEKSWMATVETCFKEYANDPDLKDYIYTGGITENTTIADVAGKIILKANVNATVNADGANDHHMSNYMDVSAGTPSLFSEWLSREDVDDNTWDNSQPRTGYEPDGVPLTWGTSHSNVQATTGLKWIYQELTTIGEDGGQIPSIEMKQSIIGGLFDKSAQIYQEHQSGEASPYWFMNDVSGCILERNATDATTQGILNGIESMNNYVVNKMGQRIEKNAPLGLVYMSYANRNTENSFNYNCGELIQTIIDNNFRFNLRRKPTGTPAQQYNATYQNGGDAISH